MKMNMGDALLRNAQRFPNRLAIVDERRRLTHLDLHLRTNRLGNYLLSQGICSGTALRFSAETGQSTSRLSLPWPKLE